MIELFKEAHILAREIHDLHAVGVYIPQHKTERLRELMDALSGYAVLTGPLRQ